jgi:predicted PurR-regulated permease PerM
VPPEADPASTQGSPLDPVPPRVILIRPGTVAMVLGLAVLFALALMFLYVAWHVITWILVALFLALALNPAVEFLVRRGVGRGIAAAIVFVAALAAIAGMAFLLLPPLVREIRDFIEAVPDIVDDLTAGRGPLGFLERDYDIVARLRDAIERSGGAERILGATAPVLSVVQSILTLVAAVVSIAFMTFFMLLEGPKWVERFYAALPDASRPRWERIGDGIYRTVSGYVTGNLLISLIAGSASTVMLLILDVPYAIALGVLVGILDLIPLAGATLAAIVVTLVTFATEGLWPGLIVLAFFIVYQQVENHVLQPVVYGRTVELSPLAVLIAVLIGAELAGVLGALGAIPVAGTLVVILRELALYRRERRVGNLTSTARV